LLRYLISDIKKHKVFERAHFARKKEWTKERIDVKLFKKSIIKVKFMLE